MISFQFSPHPREHDCSFSALKLLLINFLSQYVTANIKYFLSKVFMLACKIYRENMNFCAKEKEDR